MSVKWEKRQFEQFLGSTLAFLYTARDFNMTVHVVRRNRNCGSVETDMGQYYYFRKDRYSTELRSIKNEACRVLHPILYICRANSRDR